MSPRFHQNIRGAEAVRRSRSFEGRFGRIFRDLPPAEFKPADLLALAESMLEPADASPAAGAEAPGQDSWLAAGYTYLGQFIDHDITFDPASSLQRDNDPDSLVDYRTPRFDLDSVYGRGPLDQPYL